MYKRYTTDEEFNKARRLKGLINCIVLVCIGILFAVLSFFGFGDDEPFSIGIGIFALSAFSAGGVFMFLQPRLMEKKNSKLDDPDSKEYKKHQTELEYRKKELMNKSTKHRSLRYYLCFRTKTGTLFSVCIAAGLLCLFVGIYSYAVVLLVAGILGVVSLFTVFSGQNYSVVIQEYQKHGFDQQEAEADFAESKVYAVKPRVLSVSRNIILCETETIVIPVRSVVWVFTGYEKMDIYDRLTRIYHITVLLDDGSAYQINCPEAVCMLMTEDIVSYGTNVTTGFSQEMFKLYTDDPLNFRTAEKPVQDVRYSPVHVSLQQKYQIIVPKTQV